MAQSFSMNCTTDTLATVDSALEQLIVTLDLLREIVHSGCKQFSEGQELTEFQQFRKSLGTRARRALLHLHAQSFNELTEKTADDVLRLPHIGMTTLCELRKKLAERGMHLQGDEIAFRQFAGNSDQTAKVRKSPHTIQKSGGAR